ncbi:DUF3168 domain-containing protein [Cereibacter sphaeroides]|nr:DUF3168 domain-containing protein [Cereibacter sphaeroides]
MEEAFIALLRGASAVTDLVAAASINFGSHPQGRQWPGVILHVVDDAEGLTLEGGDGLSQGRVQVDCYAETFTEAKAVSRAIKALLHGYAGGGFSVIQHVSTRDGRAGEAATNVADRPFRVSLDFLTFWRE